MSESLRKKTGLALFWSFIDKGGQQVIQFVFVYILARLVEKEEFGLITVLSLFVVVANILQESGFSSALIRKKEVQQEEYSSVFYFNISVSAIIYLILFLLAPYIGRFYEMPILTDLSRFVFLSFVFNAFGIIQNVNLIKKMNFKVNTRITLIAGLVSGLAAIIMAYNGLGVWSLAAQQVIQSFLRSVFLWIYVKWRPLSTFAFTPIREMSAFSTKLLLSSLLNQICANIFPLIVGKKFSMMQVASYGQGVKLTNIPQSIISDGIKSVAYPLLTHIGSDDKKSNKALKKIVRITSFISFPIALLLIVMAKPIVAIYLPPQWADVIPILQILAIGGAFYPLYSLIGSLLQYKGKAGKYLSVELIRNILLLSSIFISIRFGILGLAWGISIVNITAFFIGIHMSGKYISYSIKDVLLDIGPYLGIAIICYLPMFFLDKLGVENIYLLFIIPLFGGSSLYLLITKISGSVILQETIDFVKQSLK